MPSAREDEPKGQYVAVPTHVSPNLVAHAQAHVPTSQQEFCSAHGSSSKENDVLCINPHQLGPEVMRELLAISAVPGKIDNVASTLVLDFLNVPRFTLAE